MTLHEDKPILLLVDDEATNLQVLRQILQDDYRLLYAKDGEKALELAQNNAVELILLDIMMPAMTGYEVCRQLKAMPATAPIPVIFVTALCDVKDEADGFEAGAVDYITKPVSPPIVRARVRTHLSLVDAEELRRSRLQVIQTLGQAAEYKDNETGMHVIRMSYYARSWRWRRLQRGEGGRPAQRGAHARRGQDRHPRRHPAKTGQARCGRMEGHAQPRGNRRRHHRRTRQRPAEDGARHRPHAP